MDTEPKCAWWEIGCQIGEGLGDLADNAITEFVESIYDGALGLMKLVTTFWLETPSPDIHNAAVSSLRADLSWYVAAFAVLGFFIGLIRLVISQDVKNSLVGLATPIVNLILAASVYATGIGLLLKGFDQLSLWLVDRATGSDIDLTKLVSSFSILMASPGAAFILAGLLFLGALVNLVFMFFRDIMFLVLMAFIVVLAASSGSEQGRQAWRKANGWLLALLLFKPVAAGIYALGFRMMVQNEGEEVSVIDALGSTVTALLILVLSALALPALISFIVPAAAVGSGAFSGGAAMGAGVAVAAGATVLASGGAGMAAGGAAGTLSSGGQAAGALAGAASGGGTPGGSSGGTASASSSSSGGTASGSTGVGGSSPEKETKNAGSTSSGTSPSTANSNSSTAAGVSGQGPGGASATGATGPAESSTGSTASSSGQGPSGASATGVPGPAETSTGSTASSSGPTGAGGAFQKMTDVRGLAQGVDPSKLIDEEGS